MPRRLDLQYVFLTYPHSDFNHDEFYQFINGVRATKWCRIATEQHADGNPHMHVVAAFEERFQPRDIRIFDYNGQHPNIQAARSWKKSLAYVAKDGQFTDFGDIPDEPITKSMDEALALARDPDESKYLTACLKARVPYQYAKRLRELAFMDTSTTLETFEPEQQWMVPGLRRAELPENSCAVLVGPTGIGKSVWAKWKAPKPVLWVSHLDVLRLYRPSYHQSIIFDDMCFKHMPVQAQIHLTDWTDSRHIHVRYGTVSVPAKTIKIFTCNEWPFEEHPAIQRRVTSIDWS